MEPWQQVLAILLFFAPYIMMFTIIKWAFSLNRTLGGMVGNISKLGQNFRGNQAKKRAGLRAENMAKMKAGNRFADNALTRPFNSTTRALGTGVRGRFGMGKRGAEAMDQATRSNVPEFMKTASFQALQDDDDALRAMSYSSASEARRSMAADFGMYKKDAAGNITNKVEADAKVERAINAVQAGPRFGKTQQIAAANQLYTTGTGYDDIEQAASTAARASGGNMSTASSIVGYGNAISKQKGRHDLAPGAGNFVAMTQDKVTNKNSSVNKTKALVEGWNSGSLYQIANGKGKGTKSFADNWVKQYETALQTGNQQALLNAEVARQEFAAMLPNATGDNQIIINDALEKFSQLETAHIGAPAIGPPTAAQAAAQANIQDVKSRASQRARTYQRPDPSTLGP